MICVFRMLLVTKSHHAPDDVSLDRENTRRMSLCKESVNPWTGTSQFLATTNKIIQFSNGREPKVNFQNMTILFSIKFFILVW